MPSKQLPPGLVICDGTIAIAVAIAGVAGDTDVGIASADVLIATGIYL